MTSTVMMDSTSAGGLADSGNDLYDGSLVVAAVVAAAVVEALARPPTAMPTDTGDGVPALLAVTDMFPAFNTCVADMFRC